MYNYSEKCAKAHEEQNRKRHEQTEAKYKRLFSEQGQDENFEFVCYEKNKKIRVKCKKCGLESLRGNDIFKGKQKRLLCRSCGNGMILYSPFVDEVLAFYQEGHSVTDTCVKYNIKKSKLNDWIKRQGVTNGRTFEEGGRECNQARADKIAPDSHNKSYYQRAKLHGAPAEIGVTLQNLIKRDGLTCAICGLECIYGDDPLALLYPTMDHIIPISKGGGHTWDNVQIAHRICNINKSNLIGEEWKNAS